MLRNRNLNITTWRGGINDLCHAFSLALDARPTGCSQHNNRDFAALEVLLILEILVSRDQNGKAVRFGLLQQFTVFQIVPAKLKGRDNLMGGEVLAKRAEYLGRKERTPKPLLVSGLCVHVLHGLARA